ncbi:ABC transporter permease [Gemmata sp. JC717]|uniref:ABC transporter permease n=1 Tax=Gemmata algarum TaxID=2975278 RepID=UPI0021BB0C7E|nr:ABC transporter permease [Gemmata algarum]MDY3555425.1 ABC transporter permease [Gemmata algarum]
MTAPLFGILQLDRGDPWGYAELQGLVQAWLQDAGGFAAVGLAVYLLYALATPTDKSESERLRVPVSTWMLGMAALALVSYAIYVALIIFKKGEVPVPPPPQPGESPKPELPVWHGQSQAIALMIGGLFSLLGLCEPFVRDLYKILRRNVSFNSSGARRFGHALGTYTSGLMSRRLLIAVGGAVAAYLAIGAVLFAIGAPQLTAIWAWLLAVGAGVALAALAVLMLFEAEGPVWAIAKLSFKEVIRKRVLWVFLIMLLPALFPWQWFFPSKPSDELRNTTGTITFVLSILCLVPGVLLAALGIPDDIKSLNIFTIVSKPVERFEIVLGRFIGYVSLMTLVLLGLTGISVALIANTSVSPQARAETYKARVPHRGKLEFKSMLAQDRQEKKDFEGTNVGREFDYRRYIAGHPDSPQRGIWKFATVPTDLERPDGDRVPLEFTFDVYRMTKGEQDAGVLTNFTVVTHNAPQRQPSKQEGAEWRWVDADQGADYAAAVQRLTTGALIDARLAARLKGGEPKTDQERGEMRLAQRMKSLAEKLKASGVKVTEADGLVTAEPANVSDPRPGTPAWKAVSALAEEFGFFELRGKRVLDYTVMGIEVPAGLFRNANQGAPGKDERGQALPRLAIYVKCESPGQLLGMAEPDLYLLRNELRYEVNFFKSMVGLWCRLCMFIGVAVAASTYLSGILAFLLSAGIYIIGLFTDHLTDLATGRNIGGPFQSLSQIVKAEQSTAQVTDSAGTRALMFGDKIAAWFFRRFQNLIPDVESFSWGHFVAEGFNINAEYLVVNVVVTAGYLLPWAVLAYYLMRNREVAA